MPEPQIPADAIPLAPQKAAGPIDKSIDVQLPDGRTVTMKRPKCSLSLALNMVLSDVQMSSGILAETERNRVKSLMFISAIDGVNKPMICDPVSRGALEQEIGDENLDGLFIVWFENFPSVSPTEMKVVKKS